MIQLPPGPKSVDFEAYNRDQINSLLSIAEKYGDIAYYKLGIEEFVLLNHPDYIKEVLVNQAHKFVKARLLREVKALLGEGLITSEGEFHHRQRRLAQPAFHRQRLEEYAATMSAFAQKTREAWRAGEVRDLSKEMAYLTLTVVAKTLFGAEVEPETHEIWEALTACLEWFNLSTLPYQEIVEKLPVLMQRFQKARGRLDATIYRAIAERRKSGKDRGDLLSMLLAAQDTERDGGRMTDQQVRDEVMSIFLAGHETTANALTWTWYLLSEHPEAEKKLHEEVDSILQGKLPGFHDVPRLQYTGMVLAEAMRLFPPIWIIIREAIEPCQIGPYVIPVGTTVLICQFVMHHNPKYYPEPYVFRPERWTPEAREARPKFTYFPFGGGIRLCIGEQFAWIEGALVLATLAQKWKLRRVEDHPVELSQLLTLRPRHGMKMVLHGR